MPQSTITVDQASFTAWDLSDADHAVELHHETAQFLVRSWNNNTLSLGASASHMGFVLSGPATLDCDAGRFLLQPGMFFHVAEHATVQGQGCGQLISQIGFRGMFQIGGPVEQTGRLQYIDGCSDTLLIPPAVRGESCLNLLQLPANTQQTAHTHPSFRAGLIMSGRGVCKTNHGSHPLSPGTAFLIPAGLLHSFHTQDESLRVIAFHPDSDFGPWHDDHPMVNRTIVNGVSAAKLTREQRRI